MKDLQELREQSNRASVDLLFTDAEMALTFLDLARTSRNDDLRKRRIHEALKAYNFIRGHIPSVTLTASQKIALNKKMALLKLRLGLT